eukprot:99902-Chlamydomonas_euryale.AAC.2
MQSTRQHGRRRANQQGPAAADVPHSSTPSSSVQTVHTRSAQQNAQQMLQQCRIAPHARQRRVACQRRHRKRMWPRRRRARALRAERRRGCRSPPGLRHVPANPQCAGRHQGCRRCIHSRRFRTGPVDSCFAAVNVHGVAAAAAAALRHRSGRRLRAHVRHVSQQLLQRRVRRVCLPGRQRQRHLVRLSPRVPQRLGQRPPALQQRAAQRQPCA